jgi:hypothetical protein
MAMLKPAINHLVLLNLLLQLGPVQHNNFIISLQNGKGTNTHFEGFC